MSKMIGVLGKNVGSNEELFLLETINPLSLLQTKSVSLDKGLIAVSSSLNAPLKGKRIYEQENDIICFCGDLVGFQSIPWDTIANIIKSKEYERFKNFRGNFALAHLNKADQRIALISDRRSQQPLYYQLCDQGFVFSTEMATFCRLKEPAGFDERWLFDYFFFNYPLSQTTFLKGVFKMPPASVLDCRIQECKISIMNYAEIFRKRSILIESPESFRLAANTFKDRVPQYFNGAPEIACALTEGWDGRTMLALAPDPNKVVTYTYGVPGCNDLAGGSKTAKNANVKHLKIVFGDNFVKNLPQYMINTVFLSSGLEKILRATLYYVYENLTNSGGKFPLTISGIALDGMFRGHACTPPIVSFDVAKLFSEGKINSKELFWPNVFKNDYSEFEKHIHEKLNYLQNTFGDFKSSEHHLLYKLYITHPELFGGELKIAENFTTLRVPSWDADIIGLAFSIKESALSFSEFTGHTRGSQSEIKLQAYMLNEFSHRLAKIPVANTRPDIALKNQYIYELYRIFRGISNRARNFYTKYQPLENWDYWLNVVHKNFIDDLIFSNASLIREYIANDFLEAIKQKREIHWIGKLATTEIILRLIRNKWQNNL